MIRQSGLLPFSEMDGEAIHPTFHHVLVLWSALNAEHF